MDKNKLVELIQSELPFVKSRCTSGAPYEWTFIKKSLSEMVACCSSHSFDIATKQRLNINFALLALYPELKSSKELGGDIQKLFAINRHFQAMGIQSLASALKKGGSHASSS